MTTPIPTCPRCASTNVSRHMTPDPIFKEENRYTPIREHGYRCTACTLLEDCFDNEDRYEAYRQRWNDPIPEFNFAEYRAGQEARMKIDDERERAYTWPNDESPSHRVSTRELRAASLVEHREFERHAASPTDYSSYYYGFPVGEEFTAACLADPDNNAPRWDYARWLRSIGTDAALGTAGFIEGQLIVAESRRADPRANVLDQFGPPVFWPRDHPDADPRRLSPGVATYHDAGGRGLGESMDELFAAGLAVSPEFYRGFIEHVAMKAARFLEIADELFSRAPIRHLTLTYCKGTNHDDLGLYKALLDSPYLERIRSLCLPVSLVENPFTVLNHLTDADLALLADSTRVRDLRYLEFQDHRRLTIKGLEALALSPNLLALSAVKHDLYRYSYPGTSISFGNLGRRRRELDCRALPVYAEQLEARHGRIPWLHPVENYGTDDPDLEAVVEHPVALLERARSRS